MPVLLSRVRTFILEVDVMVILLQASLWLSCGLFHHCWPAWMRQHKIAGVLQAGCQKSAACSSDGDNDKVLFPPLDPALLYCMDATAQDRVLQAGWKTFRSLQQ